MTKEKEQRIWESFEIGDEESRFNGLIKKNGKIVACTIYVNTATHLAQCAESLRESNYLTCIGNKKSIKTRMAWRKGKVWRDGFVAGAASSGVIGCDKLEEIRKEIEDEETSSKERSEP